MPSLGQRGPRAAIWLLANARPNVVSMPMTSPVDRISGPRIGVDAREAVERQDRLLHRRCDRRRPAGSRPSLRSSASVAPTITRAATLASGTPVAFATKGTVRLARGFASMTNTWPSLHRVLHVEQTPTSRAAAMPRCSSSMTSTTRGGERRRREHACAVARVHARLLDVLHDAADEHLAGARHGWRRRRPRWRPRGSGRSAPAARPTAHPRGRASRSRASSAIAARKLVVVVDDLPSPGHRARTTAARAPGSRCAR